MVNSIRNIYIKWATKRLIIFTITLTVFSILYSLFAYQKISNNTDTLISQKDSLYKVAYDKKAGELLDYSREQSKEKGETVWYFLSDKKNKEIFDERFNSDFDSEIISYNISTIGLGVLIFALIFTFLLYFLKNPPLYCPYCYKTILPKSIVPFICPFCKTENKLFKSLYTTCENLSCKSVIPAIQCSHCHSEIGLLAEYDLQKIMEKRYGKKTKI